MPSAGRSVRANSLRPGSFGEGLLRRAKTCTMNGWCSETDWTTLQDDTHEPDFFIMGTEKGGSTYLLDCLREHPGIFMPRKGSRSSRTTSTTRMT